MRKSSKPIKAILTVADIHAGSVRALLPPGFVTVNENEIVQNRMQQELWEQWEDFNRWVEETMNGDGFALVINGDAVEGVHHKTTEIISSDSGDHLKAAIEILEPLARKAEAVFVVAGTECHTHNQEQTLAKVLRAKPDLYAGVDAKGEPRSWAHQRLTIDFNGLRLVWRHHIGTSIRRGLAATQLSINLAEEQLEAVNNGEIMPNVVCCAHRHVFGSYENDNGIIIVSPPWQGLTRFGHKVVSQSRTKSGGFLLDFRGKSKGELPDVRKRLYESPRPCAWTPELAGR